MSELERKRDKLSALLQAMKTVAICFSGGVDSTFLAAAAGKVLKPGDFMLFHVRSPMIPHAETAFAEEWAAANGFLLKILAIDLLKHETVVRNDFNRCYYCKTVMIQAVAEAAAANSLALVADGLNCDDLDDYRPGTRAADENGVRHPLLEADLNKAEIRELAARWQLPNRNALPSACLASRLPFGMRITAERLRMIENGEEFLRSLGYQGCRVRFFDVAGARIELQSGDFASAVRHAGLIVEKFQAAGFNPVVLDLAGYKRGGGHNPA